MKERGRQGCNTSLNYSNKAILVQSFRSIVRSITPPPRWTFLSVGPTTITRIFTQKYFEYSTSIQPRISSLRLRAKKKKKRNVRGWRRGGRADRDKNAIKIVGKRPRRACSPDSRKDPEDETIPPRRIQCSHADSFACIYSWPVCA